MNLVMGQIMPRVCVCACVCMCVRVFAVCCARMLFVLCVRVFAMCVTFSRKYEEEKHNILFSRCKAPEQTVNKQGNKHNKCIPDTVT